MWSSDQSSWLQIHRSGFDSRSYQIFWEVVCLELGPLNLVSKIEELLEGKSRGSFLKIREYGRRDQSRHAIYATPFYPQMLAVTSSTSGGRSVGIVRSRILVTEFSFVLWYGTISRKIVEPIRYLIELDKFNYSYNSIRRSLYKYVELIQCLFVGVGCIFERILNKNQRIFP
jgi:hypothetical protein